MLSVSAIYFLIGAVVAVALVVRTWRHCGFPSILGAFGWLVVITAMWPVGLLVFMMEQVGAAWEDESPREPLRRRRRELD